MLVTLEQAKAHLRVVESGEDADITLKLEAAELAALNYLNRPVFATQGEVDSADAESQPLLVNAAIKAAILLTLGDLYASREDTVIGASVAALPGS